MKFRIHFDDTNGNEDHVVVEGKNIEQIRQRAKTAVKKRNGKNPWSEEIK